MYILNNCLWYNIPVTGEKYYLILFYKIYENCSEPRSEYFFHNNLFIPAYFFFIFVSYKNDLMIVIYVSSKQDELYVNMFSH